MPHSGEWGRNTGGSVAPPDRVVYFGSFLVVFEERAIS